MTPAWVYKRDGRLVPFDAAKISRALFAATEELGRPDAFLARELTDGVVHFLAADFEGTTPTTAQVADFVVKVVRELGQPALAQAFADHSEKRGAREEAVSGQRSAISKEQLARSASEGAAPLAPRPSLLAPLATAVRQCRRDYTLREVFTRDLVAAHREGLLVLTGLETPFELAGCVLGSPATGLVEAVEEAGHVTGELLALDGPEYLLASTEDVGGATAAFVRELGIGLRMTGLRAVVNLNCATPPAWADDLAAGPLFTARQPAPSPARRAEVADSLLERLRGVAWPAGQLRIDWHLGEEDFADGAERRLLPLARVAAGSAAVAFVFDRPRRAVALAEGMTRRHPAVLLTVGLGLPRLLRQLGPQRPEPERFLDKLGSLARLALSAGVQKRDFLRRHGDAPALQRGFLLDRARFVAAPIGLETTVQALFGRGPCGGGPALEFARRVVQRLRDVLREDGQGYLLDTCLDGPADFALDDAGDKAGLTAWDAAATVKQQLRTAGALHAAEMGTAAVLISEERPPSAEQIVDWLRWAWHQTEIVRLRFVRAGPASQQLTLHLEAERD